MKYGLIVSPLCQQNVQNYDMINIIIVTCTTKVYYEQFLVNFAILY